MTATTDRFDENSLRADIVATWGTYGAHAEVFDFMNGEIDLLRHVVRILAAELSPPCDWAWMKDSPADKAYYRALNSGR